CSTPRPWALGSVRLGCISYFTVCRTRLRRSSHRFGRHSPSHSTKLMPSPTAFAFHVPLISRFRQSPVPDTSCQVPAEVAIDLPSTTTVVVFPSQLEYDTAPSE